MLVIAKELKMKEIAYIQLEEEAKNVVQFDAKAMKCGGNRLKHERNEFGMTLKYLFAVKDWTFKDVGERLGISSQAINHLVNRTKAHSFTNKPFVERLCISLNIDYKYFIDLSSKVKELM